MPRITETLDAVDDTSNRVVVNPATAAEMLDCTRQHIYALMERGDLRSVSIGRMRRIPVEDIYRLAGLDVPPRPYSPAK